LNSDNDSASDELDLRALLRPLRRRWWLVVAIVVVVTAAAYLVDAHKAKVFQATTSVYVDTTDNPAGQFEGTQLVLPSNDAVADLARLARSTSVGVQLKRALHSPLSPDALLAQVTATPDANADFVDITATGGTGAAAAALANAYAQSFVAVGTQQVTKQLTQLEQASNQQLKALNGTAPAVVAQRQALQSRIAQIKSAAASVTGPEQQLDAAAAPTAPISPRPKRAAAIAFLLALLNAIIIVYLLERLDRRVKQLDDLTATYDLPLLGVIPHVEEPALLNESGAALDPAIVESLRFLRVNLSLQTLDSPIKLLLVTSALPSEGKSTVVRNLALAYREAGVDVVVVDADLRRPSLPSALGWRGTSGGLTSILVGDVPVSEAVVRAPVFLPGLRGAEAAGPAVTIGFLPSGAQAANPPAILGSVRMATVLRQLAAEHDLVIIDSPPLLAVSDTLPLLSIVDGVVLVARVGHTTREAIRRTKTALQSIPTARVFGFVAEDSTVSSDFGYGYGYGGHGYTSASGYASANNQSAPAVVSESAPPVASEVAPPVVSEAAPPVASEVAPPVVSEAAPPVASEAVPPVVSEAAPAVASGQPGADRP
jgi:capsular exopolysaccharide synthesis family protein